LSELYFYQYIDNDPYILEYVLANNYKYIEPDTDLGELLSTYSF